MAIEMQKINPSRNGKKSICLLEITGEQKRKTEHEKT